MELNKLISTKSSQINVKAKTKKDFIRKLAELASKDERCKDIAPELIEKLLEEREELGSTGFGNGIAIPHARIPGMKEFIIFIVTSRGVEFDAIDKKKVKLFFVILGPEEAVNEHLQILAAISRCLGQTSLKDELLGSRKNEVLIEIFQKNTIEEKKQASDKKQKMKLMIIILYLDEFLYHILEYFIEEEIDGASIMESAGMGQYISNVPLFATFVGFMNEQKNQSKTILAMIPEDKEEELIKGIEQITGDLDEKDGAMIITLDVSYSKGSMRIL